MRAVIDMTGRRFGRLVAVRQVAHQGGRVAWLFNCDCGAEHVALGENVRSGATQSCGCHRVAAAIATNITHGHARIGRVARLYRTWRAMKARCCDPANNRYRWYGARGITVCDEWHSFEPFRDWALANGYADDLTIDRIDPDQGYAPSNCRWLTKSENSRRRRNARAVHPVSQ